MIRDIAEAMHLDESGAVTLRDLVELSGLAEAVLRELVDYGALQPVDVTAPAWTFTTEVVVTARTAQRLQHDFELDVHALAVVLRYVERIDSLESEIRALRARALR